MTYEEALVYIQSVNPTFCKPGLDRIRALCERLGHPEKDLPVIHVTGTNGKGSVCAMLSAVLSEAGYRVGLFSSPFVKRRNESMRIGKKEISDQELAALTERVRPFVDVMEEKPTDFELSVAIALLYFREKTPDVVIIETGMGARKDATNLFSSVLLSIVTNISLEHTTFLGHTVEAIAREKAGVIKEGCPVLYGGEEEEALAVLKQVAEEKHAPLFTVSPHLLSVESATLEGFTLSYKTHKSLFLSLLGVYQPRNAAIVLDALKVLRPRFSLITEDAIRKGLSSVSWPARFEILSHRPLILFDGGHNPAGIRQATESIRTYFGDKKICLVSGILRDKDLSSIGKELSSVAAHIFTVTPPNPRALPAKDYAEALTQIGVSATACPTVEAALSDALRYAEKNALPLLILGSLYLYDCVTQAWGKAN